MSTTPEQNAAAHTPGPWAAERMFIPAKSKDRRSGFVVNGADSGEPLSLPVRICDLRVPAGVFGFSEGEANARLIAAAPDLLAACAKMLARWDALSVDNLGQGCHAIAEQARAAIKKAATQ